MSESETTSTSGKYSFWDKVGITAIAVIAGVPITVFTAILTGIIHGKVLSILWGWFIAPKFHLPVLSFPEAFALITVVMYVFYNPEYIKNEYKDDAWTRAITNILIKPLVYLCTGWMIRLIWLH